MRVVSAALCTLCALCALVTAAPQAAAPKTTLTYTATSTITARPTLSSGGFTTVATKTSYSLRNGDLYNIVYDYTSTGTQTTYTYTVSTTVSLSAKTTVTVPTPTHFTPVLSESYYTDAVTVKYVPSTVTSPVYLHPSPVTYTSKVVTWSTTVTSTTTTASYYYVNVTTSTTFTDASKTRTSYAACATNNLASKIPTGQDITTVNFWNNLYYPDPQVGTAHDCCQACFNTPGCTGGHWAQDSYYKNYYCEIYTVNPNNASQTCDPRQVFGNFDHSPNPYESSPNVVFNGPCGQWAWQFEAANYNH